MNHWKIGQDGLIRLTIGKLRGPLGFLNLTHLNLYEIPKFLRECYSEGDICNILEVLKFGQIKAGEE